MEDTQILGNCGDWAMFGQRGLCGLHGRVFPEALAQVSQIDRLLLGLGRTVELLIREVPRGSRLELLLDRLSACLDRLVVCLFRLAQVLEVLVYIAPQERVGLLGL